VVVEMEGMEGMRRMVEEVEMREMVIVGMKGVDVEVGIEVVVEVGIREMVEVGVVEVGIGEVIEVGIRRVVEVGMKGVVEVGLMVVELIVVGPREVGVRRVVLRLRWSAHLFITTGEIFPRINKIECMCLIQTIFPVYT
jgi:hypothetical protein